MYSLIAIDTVARIVVALLFLFVVIPRMAWRQQARRGKLERFWWNFGVGSLLLTLTGQLLTPLRLTSSATLLALCGAVVVFGRARQQKVTPGALVRRWSDCAFLAVLNVAERRVNVRRRLLRALRDGRRRLDATFRPRSVRVLAAGWAVLVAVAAALRSYRPFASANLGFSDTYVHLYLVKLLQDGRQVDPAWGPYPRGMHFLLLAIKQLTNADEIVLVNFFGAVIGVLIALGVADAARRLSGRVMVGLLAGLLYAMFVGGPKQYFVLGGMFTTPDAPLARDMLAQPYEELAASGAEFDVAFTAFQRQTSTLSQEMALVFLLPAVMFLFGYFRQRDRWQLVGFIGCTGSIAAAHSGVLIPLVLLCGVAALASLVERSLRAVTFRRATLAGAAAVVTGSLWALAFIAYPYSGPSNATRSSQVGNAALYYFPVLRSILDPESEPAAVLADEKTFAAVTPFLMTMLVLAVMLMAVSFALRRSDRGSEFWTGAATLVLLLVHFSSMLGFPEIIQAHRNVAWLGMLLSILVSMTLALWLRAPMPARRFAPLAMLVLVLVWMSRIPRLDTGLLHERLTSYSGYGATALAVLQIEREYEPYSWTLVSYGQEFPMVLKRGFHMPAADFLAEYDPAAPVLKIPSQRVFIVVERVPHRFQVNDWSPRFTRTDIAERLQTWCTLYQLTHTDMRLTYDDGQVRVYAIERSGEEAARIAEEEAKP